MSDPPSRDRHHLALERMFHAAPINRLYRPSMTVGDGVADIRMQVTEAWFHPAGAAHGSVYFKILDDAAYFAVSSRVRDVFILTTSFETDFLRPLPAGSVRATGRVLGTLERGWEAEAVLYGPEGHEVARGRGRFVRGPTPLAELEGYADGGLPKGTP